MNKKGLYYERKYLMKVILGKKLNVKWSVGAKHALAHKDGNWYEYLERFPGALFDIAGYVIFRSNREYVNCKYLAFGKKVHVPKGISNMPGYIKVK